MGKSSWSKKLSEREESHPPASLFNDVFIRMRIST